MRPARLGQARPVIQANKAVILFWVGPYRMGIDAGALQEIRDERGLSPEEYGRTAILSAHALFGVPSGPEARLLMLRGGRVAVRVDRVERMIASETLRLLPRAFQGAERAWYCGLALAGEMVFPIVNPATLEREAQSAGRAALSPDEAPRDVLQEVISS